MAGGGAAKKRAAACRGRAWGRWLIGALGLVGALGAAIPVQAHPDGTQAADALTNLSINFATGAVSFSSPHCTDTRILEYRYGATGSWSTYSCPGGDSTRCPNAPIANRDYVAIRMYNTSDPPHCTSSSPRTAVIAYTRTTLATGLTALTEANLNGATLTVVLGSPATTLTATPAHAAFASGVGASGFEIVTTPSIPGLSHTVGPVTAGGRTATVTLAPATDGTYGFDVPTTIALRVLAAAHTGSAAITSAPLPVTPTAGVRVSESNLALTEAAGSSNQGVYTVTLASQPASSCSGGVGVTVASSNTADVTVAPTTLTFSSTTWNTAQAVTATAQQDADGTNDAATISHSIGTACDASGYTTSLSLPSVAMTVTDDDVPSARIYASAPSGLHQRALNGSRIGVEVTNTNWVSSVQVSNMLAAGLTVHDFFALATSVPGLTLNEIVDVPSTSRAVLKLTYDGTDFNTPRAVTVTVKAAAHTGSEDLTTQARPVVPAYDLDVSAATAGLDVAEEASGTYTVRLSSQPVGAVTVTVEAPFNTDVTVAPMTLTYTGGASGTWNTAQTVTVRVADDADGADETATVAHAAAAGSQDPRWTFSPQSSESVTVRVTDNDVPGLAVDPPLLQLTEAASGTYTVMLATAPTSAVTVTVGGTTTTVTADVAAAAGDQTSLTFSPTTWNTAQTVTVTAADDANSVSETVTLTHGVGSNDAAYTALAAGRRPSVTVEVTDNDVPALLLDANPATPGVDDSGPLALSEDPLDSTHRQAYTVRLQTQPSGGVTVTVTVTPDGTVTVAPATLTFAATTWATAQTVTATAVADDDGQDATGTLTHAGTGGDYAGVTRTLTVTVTDDDPPGVTVAPTDLTVNEAGTAGYTVRLATQPVGGIVTIRPGVQSGGDADLTLSPAAPVLTFTATTWATAQFVTVQAAADDDAVHGTATVAHTIEGADYGGVAVADVTVRERDDDVPGLRVEPTEVTVPERGTARYTVRLTTDPAASVTVTLTVTADTSLGGVTVAPATLAFSATTWATAQAVTVTAADDDDGTDETATVRHAAGSTPGSTYASVDSVDVTVAVEDDDMPGFMFAPAVQLVVAAGSTAAYTVQLTSEPTGDVMVTLTHEDGVTVAPAGLTFTASHWNTAQPVTVTVAAGTTDPISRVRHTGTGGDYEGVMKTLVVARMAVPIIEPTDPIETRGKPGEHCDVRNGQLECRYFRNDQLVTVTEAADGPPGVTFMPDAPLTRPLTLAVRTLTDAEAADEVTDAAGSRFRLGLALDVTVTPSQPGRLCLPVREEVRRAAGSRRVHLLHTPNPDGDGMWTSLAEGAPDDPICAHIPSTSPFAVGYENLGINFAEDAQTLFPFRTGQEVNQPLPGIMMGGHPDLTYTLLPVPPASALPAGLRHDTTEAGVGHGGTLVGTPTVPMTAPYKLRAVDGDKNTDELLITIEVTPGIERRDLAMVLAGVGRTLAADAVEILGSRGGPPPSRLHVTLGGQVLRLTAPAQAAPAAAPAPAAGTPSPLASAPSPLAGEGRGEGAAAVAPAAPSGPSPWQRVTGVALGVARALGVTLDTPALPSAPPGAGQSEDSTFPSAQTLLARAPAEARRPSSPTWRSPLSLQPVSAKDLLARSAFELPLTRTDADGLPTWTVWGRGAASGFAGQPEEGFKMDGTLYSGYLGLDYRQASLLMGLAVAHSTGTVDYERTGGTTAGVDVHLTSLLPYAHWQPYAGLGLWGLLGAGWGEMDLKAVDDDTTYTTALTSWLGAVGGRQALTTWQGIDLAAKTDAFLTTLRSEAKTNLPGARGHAERVRLLLEGQTAVALSPVSRVQPRLEVGGRWDSGTAEQGLGLELGGGLAYTQTEWGLSVEMQGRYLLVHEDGAFEDWGASVNVRLDPVVGGEGAYLTVAPVWGQPGSGVDQLWGQAAAVPGGPPAARAAGWRPANVEVDMGYGLMLADGRGLLTPYGGLVLGDPGTARYRLGSRWAMSALLDLSVEGERVEQPGQAAHSVSVRLGWQW